MLHWRGRRRDRTISSGAADRRVAGGARKSVHKGVLHGDRFMERSDFPSEKATIQVTSNGDGAKYIDCQIERTLRKIGIIPMYQK